jgi:hypothetical protein
MLHNLLHSYNFLVETAASIIEFDEFPIVKMCTADKKLHSTTLQKTSSYDAPHSAVFHILN